MTYFLRCCAVAATLFLTEAKQDSEHIVRYRVKAAVVYFILMTLLQHGIYGMLEFVNLLDQGGSGSSFINLAYSVICVLYLSRYTLSFSKCDDFKTIVIWLARNIGLFLTGFLLYAYYRLYPETGAFSIFILFMAVLVLLFYRELCDFLAIEQVHYSILTVLLADIVFYYLGFRIYGPKADTYLVYSALTVLFIFAGNIFLLLLTGSYRISIILQGLIYFIWTLIHYCVLMFRGTPFIPADWKVAGTAMDVAGTYQFVMSREIWWYLFIYIAVILITISREERKPRYSYPKRLSLCAVYAIALVVLTRKIDLVKQFSLSIATWNQTDAYQRYGYSLAYYVCRLNSKVSMPKNYSVEQIEELAAAYEVQQEQVEFPNIIVVMNETFVDLGDIGELDTNKDYMPFLHSLSSKDDFAVGRVLIPVYGGGTCQSEWEFLTGYSSEYTPQIMPYATESFDNSHTMCSILKNQGYHTIATHPGDSVNYRRNSVYKQMGFEEIYFKLDYKDYECLRDGRYMSDRDVYKKVVDLLEQTDIPTFVFAVTIQNHGGYTDIKLRDEENFEIQEKAVQSESLNQFLSLMYESDTELEKLVKKIDQMDRPTVLVAFGDHFPNLDASIYDSIRGMGETSFEERMALYSTPYFVHANYDIDYAEFEDYMSVNYLGANLMKAAGVRISPFDNYLLAMQEVIPAFNQMGYLDTEGNWHENGIEYEGMDAEERQWVEDYNSIMYNIRFDNATVKEMFE